MPTFSVNVTRYDPYKNYGFLVFFGSATAPVAAVSKIGGLKRTSDVIDYREGGNGIIRKGLGRTKYDPILLERGLTHDRDFAEWANAAQVLERGSPRSSPKALRRDIRILLLNEAGQPVFQYNVYRAWVSEYQALPDLDAGGNAIALEHIKLEHEGWEWDPSVSEPQEV
jgi:phage tail-like protein